jgi:hypothetical protein
MGPHGIAGWATGDHTGCPRMAHRPESGSVGEQIGDQVQVRKIVEVGDTARRIVWPHPFTRPLQNPTLLAITDLNRYTARYLYCHTSVRVRGPGFLETEWDF